MASTPGRVLVVGASGQVGGAMLELLGPGRASGTFRSAPFPGGLPFELERAADGPGAVRALLDRARPAAVCVAAGMTDVEACEGDEAAALRANRDAPATIAAVARSLGVRVAWYSSEYVFDGSAGPYAEDDPPAPLSAYGESKLAGEQAVLAADPDALVLRTTVVYGPERHGKNFAYRLAGRLGGGARLPVPCDQVSTPTYNRDLAAATVALLDAGAAGVWHVAGAELLARDAFARRLAAAAGLDAALVDALPTAALRQRAARPLACGLRTGRLRQRLPWFQPLAVEAAVRDWRACPAGLPWP